MIDGFIKFESKNTRKASLPVVSITPKTGRISFSTAAAEKFGIRAGVCATLYFNPQTRQIAIMVSDDCTDKNAIRMQARRGSGPYIRVPKFLEEFDISLDQASFYLLNQSEKEPGLYLIDLNEKITKGDKTM